MATMHRTTSQALTLAFAIGAMLLGLVVLKLWLVGWPLRLTWAYAVEGLAAAFVPVIAALARWLRSDARTKNPSDCVSGVVPVVCGIAWAALLVWTVWNTREWVVGGVVRSLKPPSPWTGQPPALKAGTADADVKPLLNFSQLQHDFLLSPDGLKQQLTNYGVGEADDFRLALRLAKAPDPGRLDAPATKPHPLAALRPADHVGVVKDILDLYDKTSADLDETASEPAAEFRPFVEPRYNQAAYLMLRRVPNQGDPLTDLEYPAEQLAAPRDKVGVGDALEALRMLVEEETPPPDALARDAVRKAFHRAADLTDQGAAEAPAARARLEKVLEGLLQEDHDPFPGWIEDARKVDRWTEMKPLLTRLSEALDHAAVGYHPLDRAEHLALDLHYVLDELIADAFASDVPAVDKLLAAARAVAANPRKLLDDEDRATQALDGVAAWWKSLGPADRKGREREEKAVLLSLYLLKSAFEDRWGGVPDSSGDRATLRSRLEAWRGPLQELASMPSAGSELQQLTLDLRRKAAWRGELEEWADLLERVGPAETAERAAAVRGAQQAAPRAAEESGAPDGPDPDAAGLTRQLGRLEATLGSWWDRADDSEAQDRTEAVLRSFLALEADPKNPAAKMAWEAWKSRLKARINRVGLFVRMVDGFFSQTAPGLAPEAPLPRLDHERLEKRFADALGEKPAGDALKALTDSLPRLGTAAFNARNLALPRKAFDAYRPSFTHLAGYFNAVKPEDPPLETKCRELAARLTELADAKTHLPKWTFDDVWTTLYAFDHLENYKGQVFYLYVIGKTGESPKDLVPAFAPRAADGRLLYVLGNGGNVEEWKPAFRWYKLDDLSPALKPVPQDFLDALKARLEEEYDRYKDEREKGKLPMLRSEFEGKANALVFRYVRLWTGELGLIYEGRAELLRRSPNATTGRPLRSMYGGDEYLNKDADRQDLLGRTLNLIYASWGANAIPGAGPPFQEGDRIHLDEQRRAAALLKTPIGLHIQVDPGLYSKQSTHGDRFGGLLEAFARQPIALDSRWKEAGKEIQNWWGVLMAGEGDKPFVPPTDTLLEILKETKQDGATLENVASGKASAPVGANDIQGLVDDLNKDGLTKLATDQLHKQLTDLTAEDFRALAPDLDLTQSAMVLDWLRDEHAAPPPTSSETGSRLRLAVLVALAAAAPLRAQAAPEEPTWRDPPDLDWKRALEPDEDVAPPPPPGGTKPTPQTVRLRIRQLIFGKNLKDLTSAPGYEKANDPVAPIAFSSEKGGEYLEALALMQARPYLGEKDLPRLKKALKERLDAFDAAFRKDAPRDAVADDLRPKMVHANYETPVLLQLLEYRYAGAADVPDEPTDPLKDDRRPYPTVSVPLKDADGKPTPDRIAVARLTAMLLGGGVDVATKGNSRLVTYPKDGALWNYDVFGEAIAPMNQTSVAISGSAAMGLQAAVNMGVLDFDEEVFKFGYSDKLDKETVGRLTFRRRFAEVLFHAVRTLTDRKQRTNQYAANYSSAELGVEREPGPNAFHVGNYRTLYAADREGAPLTAVQRRETLLRAPPRLSFRDHEGGVHSIYSTAGGCYTLVASSNMLRYLLEKDLADGKYPGVLVADENERTDAAVAQALSNAAWQGRYAFTRPAPAADAPLCHVWERADAMTKVWTKRFAVVVQPGRYTSLVLKDLAGETVADASGRTVPRYASSEETVEECLDYLVDELSDPADKDNPEGPRLLKASFQAHLGSSTDALDGFRLYMLLKAALITDQADCLGPWRWREDVTRWMLDPTRSNDRFFSADPADGLSAAAYFPEGRSCAVLFLTQCYRPLFPRPAAKPTTK